MSKKQEEAFRILADKMDARDRFMQSLKKFYVAHGSIPPTYAKEWAAFEADGFRSWREIPRVVKRVKKAAKRAAKAKGLEQLTAEVAALGQKQLGR